MEPTDEEVILLDGSMGHELKERLGQKWSESFQEHVLFHCKRVDSESLDKKKEMFVFSQI